MMAHIKPPVGISSSVLNVLNVLNLEIAPMPKYVGISKSFGTGVLAGLESQNKIMDHILKSPMEDILSSLSNSVTATASKINKPLVDVSSLTLNSAITTIPKCVGISFASSQQGELIARMLKPIISVEMFSGSNLSQQLLEQQSNPIRDSWYIPSRSYYYDDDSSIQDTVKNDVERTYSEILPEDEVIKLARDIIKIMYDQINPYLKHKEIDGVFCPSDMGMIASFSISGKIAHNRDDFVDVVQQLYLLIYEGSKRGENLTLYVGDTGKDIRCKPLKILKSLRNNIHDSENDNKKTPEKYYKSSNEGYQSLIGKYPTKPLDWGWAQLALYRQLLEMLNYIMEKIVEKVESNKPNTLH